MARSRSSSGGPGKETIVDVDVTSEMQGSFLEYAYSVIYSRALPDARDGLKPVQRRILHQMSQLGLRPDRGHVKSARVVGEVMGRLHPHGDGAIYDALVRMAQPFSLRLPLVDGHGNYGSPDDGPAAMRYCVAGDTRVRLADGVSARIDDLVALDGPGERELELEVLDKDGKRVRADRGFHSGSHPVFRVATRTGHHITATANHPLLCLVAPAGVPMLAWLRVDEITPGTYVCLSRHPIEGRIPEPREWQLGVLCGAWVSEGWASAVRAGFNNTDKEFFDHVLSAYDAWVGGPRYLSTRPLRRSGRALYELDVQNLSAFVASPLREFVGVRSAEKRIPEVVWRSGAAVKRAFLMAAFEGDGSLTRAPNDSAGIHYSTRSEGLCSDLQQLLLEFGITSTRFLNKARGEYRVIISNRRGLALFAERVGFLAAKQRKLERHLRTTPRHTHRLSRDFVPYVRSYLESLPPRRGSGRSWLLNHNVDRVERWEADRSLILNRIKDPEMARVVANVMDAGYRYAEVTAVEPAGTQPVYSLRVDTEDHSFLAGGFVNHNTECRLAAPALDMTSSIDEDVVDFGPNYDGRELEPEVLPAALPNLLVNGASGIAVGMATNMAPHNLGEVVAAARHLLEHPDADVGDLVKFVPGPDLPTGGMIVGLDGIRQAYESGKGSFRVRATTRIEQVSPRRQGIVVTSLPYTVGPERVVERIKELVVAKKLTGISNLTDLTDADHGLRLVIEVKSGFNPHAVLGQLFKLTPMEDQFSVNNVALVGGTPRTLGLKELLRVYLDHRLEVVRRRSEHRRSRARERLHLVEGLLIAILDIDEVIAIIRGSDDTAQARHRLMAAFDLTEVQTNYILEMPLRRLTKFSRLELEAESDDLRRTIDQLTAILDDPAELRSVVSGELADVAARHADPRRTILLESEGAEAVAADVPMEVEDVPCWVLMTNTGLLARTGSADPPAAEGPRAKHDCIVGSCRATTRGHVGVVGSDGLIRRLSVVDLPALADTSTAPALSGGTPIGALLDLPKHVRVVGLVGLADTIALGTRDGVVKRIVVEDVPTKDSWDVIRLADGDVVVGAATCPTDTHDLVFMSAGGQLLRFAAGSVRPQGRAAGGMAGIKLPPGDTVAFFGVVDSAQPGVVVTVAGSDTALPGTVPGTGKVTVARDYPAKGRGTGGVRCHKFRSGEDRLLLAWCGPTPARAASPAGVPLDLPEADHRRDGTGTPLPSPVGAVGGPVAG